MSQEILKELRMPTAFSRSLLESKAADLIEQQSARIAELESALQNLADKCESSLETIAFYAFGSERVAFEDAIDDARAALASKDEA